MTAKTVIYPFSVTWAFIKAASRYWLSIYPRIWREADRWHRRAQDIPSSTLRGLALEAQQIKRGNIEGSGAFAILAPAEHRRVVIRAQVAFQSVYDYVDTLSEQPNLNPLENGRALHQALLACLHPEASHEDYYRHQPSRADNGYLEEMVDTCRGALAALPSRQTVSASAQRITERIVAYQTLNLSDPNGGHRHLQHWADRATPEGTDLRWWETAASAGSSLGLFALIAAAARPELSQAQAEEIESAYWPWIGALHSLLDSMVDGPEDAAVGQRNLLDYYSSPQEAADRLELLAQRALAASRTLPDAREHALILAGMASFYLTSPEAASPTARLAARRILGALGTAARPSVIVFALRRAAARISSGR